MASFSCLRLCALLVLSVLVGSVNAQTVFNFSPAPLATSTIWGRVDSYISPVVAPVVYEVSGQQSMVSSYGTWILYGTQPDVDLTTNQGANFTTIAGNTQFTWLGNPDWETDFGSAYGGVGCSHRNTANRFYYMGANGTSNSVNAAFNYATVDGSTWLQILDAATATAWQSRVDISFAGCVVTAQDVVLSIGGIDTWQSINYGVTFTAVSASTRFGARTRFGVGIHSPVSGGADVITVVGGALDNNGGPVNDVWTSNTNGASWTRISATAPFAPRDSVNFAISAQGIMVVHGGSAYGGYSGWWGDMWLSVNGGANWYLLAANTAAGNRSQSTLIFDMQGYLYLFFGQESGYSWVTDAWKSNLSFNLSSLATWGPQVVSGLTVPTTALAVNSSCSTPTSNSYITYPILVSQTCAKSVAVGSGPFNYTEVSLGGVYSRADSTIAPTTAPMFFPVVYQSNALDWALAPTGSWLVWGAQQDVSLSTDFGTTWNVISGVTYAGLPFQGQVDAGFSYGGDQCQHRNTFNRFYVIGTGAVPATTTSSFVWASNNGWEWIQVLDGATQTAWANRANIEYTACVVDTRDRVYSIGGSDLWVSNNLGVTFTQRGNGNQNIYSARNGFGSGVFTNSSGFDVIFVLGGRGSVGNTTNTNYNDVWVNINNGYNWILATAAAPWTPRDSPNVAVSNYGVIALYGGAVLSGYQGWLGDTWVSLNGGVNWYQLQGTAPLFNRSQASILFDNAGFLYVFFGQAYPAYNWTTDGWKSSYSFNTISTWGPQVNSLVAVPSGYTACNPIATYPGSGQGGNNGGGGTINSSSSSSGLSNGAIAGIVIGSVVGALIILVVLLVVCRGLGRSGKKSSMGAEPSTGTGKFSNVEDSQTGAGEHTNEVEMN